MGIGILYLSEASSANPGPQRRCRGGGTTHGLIKNFGKGVGMSPLIADRYLAYCLIITSLVTNVYSLMCCIRIREYKSKINTVFM